MTGTKVAISALVAAAVLVPIVCFTDILAAVPGVDLSVFTKSYWAALKDNPEPSGGPVAVVVFVGPVLAFFLLFWYLWLQRNKQEVMLAVYARAMDVHAWLQSWLEMPQLELPEKLRASAPKARRLFKKLDRLLSITDRANWRWSYSLYLVLFYFSNGPKIRAYRGVRVEPPPTDWPTPADLAAHADPEELEIAEHAIEFSADFVNGAKAWTGLELLLHTMIGTIFGGIMAAILGVITALALMGTVGPWSAQVLASLALSLVLALVAAYIWQRVSNVTRRAARRSRAVSQ